MVSNEKNDKLSTNKDEYVLIKVCGNGGQGDVWKARNKGGKFVAIKVLRDSSKNKISRFENEINFQRETYSQYIVKAIDSKFGEKCKFYVMDYYEKKLKRYFEGTNITL